MWKSGLKGAVLAGILVLALGVGAFAQNNWGQKLTGQTESVTGTVVAVDLEAPTTSVTIKAGEENLVVELGPVWVLEDFPFKEGDTITVVGERVNNGTMVAYSLNRTDDNGNTVTLTLRDANGKPTWNGSAGPKRGNKYRNRNQVTTQSTNQGTSGNVHQSGPQNGSGNQWGQGQQGQNNPNQGQGNQHQSGPQDGSGNQWGRK